MFKWAVKTKTKKNKSLFREYGVCLVWALVLAGILRASVVQANFIPSGSMEPTLLIGDHLLISKLSYGIKAPLSDKVLIPVGAPQRGDVVVFSNPQGSGPDFVKRIIALPGETVQTRGKALYVNGNRMDDPWGRYAPGSHRGQRFGPVTVPEGQYFVLGDNRDNSFDSRYWNQGRGGFVPREDITGKVLMVLWSWDDFPLSLRLSRTGQPVK